MRSHLICALSGAATGLCLLFPEIGPASFFLMVPALSVQSAAGGRRRFSLCHSFCLALAAAGYAPVFSLRPDLSPALIFWADLLVYLTGSLIHSTLLALFLWAGWCFPCREDLRWAALSLCWAAGEWLLGAGPLAWPTLRLSLALWRYPMFLSAAPLGGQLLVSAGIAAVNALLADLLCRKRKAAAWLAAIFMAAQPLLFFLPRTPSSDFFSVSLVQPGGTTTGKEFAAIEERAIRLVQIAAEASPQLILLPENVILADLSQDGMCRSRWQSLARQCGIPILLGGQRQGRAAAFLLGADGQLKALRIKAREVPFFENGAQGRPFRLLPPIAPTTLPADPGPVGTLLCYESFFSSLCRRAVREDAAFLAVLTNDSWFFSQQAKELHLAASVFRAAETGRSVLQAGLNGCTAVIDRRGQVIAQLKGEEAGILTVRIPVEEGGTLYLLWGDLWLPLALILLTAAGRKSVRQRGRLPFTPRERMCYTVKKRKKGERQMKRFWSMLFAVLMIGSTVVPAAGEDVEGNRILPEAEISGIHWVYLLERQVDGQRILKEKSITEIRSPQELQAFQQVLEQYFIMDYADDRWEKQKAHYTEEWFSQHTLWIWMQHTVEKYLGVYKGENGSYVAFTPLNWPEDVSHVGERAAVFLELPVGSTLDGVCRPQDFDVLEAGEGYIELKKPSKRSNSQLREVTQIFSAQERTEQQKQVDWAMGNRAMGELFHSQFVLPEKEQPQWLARAGQFPPRVTGAQYLPVPWWCFPRNGEHYMVRIDSRRQLEQFRELFPFSLIGEDTPGNTIEEREKLWEETIRPYSRLWFLNHRLWIAMTYTYSGGDAQLLVQEQGYGAFPQNVVVPRIEYKIEIGPDATQPMLLFVETGKHTKLDGLLFLPFQNKKTTREAVEQDHWIHRVYSFRELKKAVRKIGLPQD